MAEVSLSDVVHRLNRNWRRLRRLLDSQIWDQDLSQESWFKAFLIRQLRVAVILIRGCTRGRIALRASAMTYTTLLTLIPLLVLALNIIRALGGLTEIELRLQAFILDVIDPGRQEQVRQWMLNIFQSARSGAFNGFSVLVLLLGGLGLLGSVEGALNDIWGVHRGRNLFQRFSTYTTLIVFGPLLIGLSLSMTASLQTSDLWDRAVTSVPVASWFFSLSLKIIPVLITSVAFTILYVVMPNVRVRLRAALPAGFAAGVIWEFTKMGYGLYLENATHLGALYGSLAAIPLFLLWVYLSWLVVLFGAHLAFAQEAAEDIRVEEGANRASLKDRFSAGLHIMLASGACHRAGMPPPDVTGLARWLGLPLRLLRSAAETLIEGGLLHQVASDPRDWALVPARDADRIRLMDVWLCFIEAKEGEPEPWEVKSAPPPTTHNHSPWGEVDELLGVMFEGIESSWGGMTLTRILDRLPEASPEQLQQESGARVYPFPSRFTRA
jgi:membrane protein